MARLIRLGLLAMVRETELAILLISTEISNELSEAGIPHAVP